MSADEPTPSNGPPLHTQFMRGVFDDIDAMAASPLAWHQEYEQIGRGRFQGELNQIVFGSTQLARVQWSPGVIQRGEAPRNTWVFGFPVTKHGTLHVRRRPARPDELMVATSRDDVGFAATGSTDLMVVVLPTQIIQQWMRLRRGDGGVDVELASPRWRVSPFELTRRALSLSSLLETLVRQSSVSMKRCGFSRIEARILDTVLDLIPSAEIILPLHNRARIARAAMEALQARLEEPPTVTELCEIVGARERTLYLSCIEAFGRSPAALLLELRLNAVQRALKAPHVDTTVTGTAVNFGFTHLSRFAAMYKRKFKELPSVTLSRSKAYLDLHDESGR